MHIVAILLDGPPSDWMFVRLLLLSLGVPGWTILVSYLLIRRKKRNVLWCCAIAALGGWAIFSAATPLIHFGYPYNPSWLVRWGPLVAASLPFIAIVIFSSTCNEPNQ